MPLVRGHHSLDGKYTQIPNEYLRDSRLSLGAIGLYAQLLSHVPGWKISLESLARANNVGKDAMRRLINELLEAGYLVRSKERERNESGQLTSYTYTTQDPIIPATTADLPTLDLPTLGSPTLGNPHHKKNITKEELLTKNTINKEMSFSESEFQSFLEAYPRRGDSHKPIREKLTQALKLTDFATIMEAVYRYAYYVDQSGQYPAMAKTWLHQERWTDDYDAQIDSYENQFNLED
jgi:hypothetical protein